MQSGSWSWGVGFVLAACAGAVGCGDDQGSSQSSGTTGGSSSSGTGGGGGAGAAAPFDLVAYVDGPAQSQRSLYAVSVPDGLGAPVRLNPDGDDVALVVVSADRAYVAYAGDDGTETVLRLFRASDGRRVTLALPASLAPVSSTPDIQWAPAPTGNRFIYATKGGHALVTIDGLVATAVALPALDGYQTAFWSPGGGHIATGGGIGHAAFQLIGTSATPVFEDESFATLAWHPVEDRLLVFEHSSGVDPYELYVASVMGGTVGPRTILGGTGGNVFEYAWSKSGHAIFYGATPVCAIASTATSAADAVCYTGQLAPAFGDLRSITWSPDDRWASFSFSNKDAGLYVASTELPLAPTLAHIETEPVLQSGSFTGDSRFLVFSHDTRSYVLDVQGPTIGASTPLEPEIKDATPSPVSSVIACTVKPIPPATDALLFRDLGGGADVTFPMSDFGTRVDRVAWSEDGQWLAVGTQAGDGLTRLSTVTPDGANEVIGADVVGDNVLGLYWLR